MKLDADKIWDHAIEKLRRKKGLSPLTPDEAKAAYAAAPSVLLSVARIEEIVKAATGGTAGPAPMSSSGSVTAWIDRLRAGDRAAVQELWQGYFQRLVTLARQRLRAAPRGMADAEDVALSAFDSFIRSAEKGRFPRLHDRDDLWHLLFVITERKAIDLVNHERREKRGGGLVRHEGSLAGDSSAGRALDCVVGPEPTPEQADSFTDNFRRLLDALGDETLRAVAVAKMEGYTNKEIAEREKVSEPTIERKLARIRKIWGKETER